MPARKKPTARLEPDQHRLCFIVKWSENAATAGSMADLMEIMGNLSRNLQSSGLGDEIYLSIDNEGVINFKRTEVSDG